MESALRPVRRATRRKERGECAIARPITSNKAERENRGTKGCRRKTENARSGRRIATAWYSVRDQRPRANERKRPRYTTLCERDYHHQARARARAKEKDGTINLTQYKIESSPYLTFPPQNWQCAPCHPSRHTQVPLTQSPFRQLSASQPVSALGDDEEVEAAALTCTTQQQTSAAHSNGHGTAIAPWHHRRRCRPSRRTAVSSRQNSQHCPFRRYLDLYRNKNICTTSAILVGFHVRDNGRRRHTDQGRAYGVS